MKIIFILLFFVTFIGFFGNAQTLVTPDFFCMHDNPSPSRPLPQLVKYSGFRPAGTGEVWRTINPSKGVYNWISLDTVVARCNRKNVEVMFRFYVVPDWATSNPDGPGCKFAEGSCYPPDTAAWADFVRVITARYNGANGHGKIQNWSLWNEPNSNGFWKGTLEQLVELARIAYPIIKRADSNNVVLSPCPQGTNAYKWLDKYFAAGGGSYCDVIAFHGYLFGAPERIVTLAENIKAVQARYPSLKGKAIWDTEHSWGTEGNGWPFSTDEDEQTAWISRFLPLSISSGIERSYWYLYGGWANNAEHFGWLYNRNTKQLRQPGVAYNEVYQWLVGSKLYKCSKNGDVYSCRVTRPGYEGLIVWSANSTNNYPAGTTNYLVPTQYTQYRQLDGTVTNITGGSSLTLTMKPYLLENINSPTNNSTDFIIYPNPTSKKIIIQWGKVYTDAWLRILDPTGRVIKRVDISGKQNFQYDLNVSAGIYFVQIKSKTAASKVKKVVVD